MYEGLTVGVVIPARDEAGAVGGVVRGLLGLRADGGARIVDDLVVCDNGSTDATAARAREAGARVVAEKTPGYGRACLTALGALRPVDVILFVDGDGSCRAEQARDLLRAAAAGADLVIGSRVPGRREPGALSPPQIAGNRVAAVLIRLLWGRRVTDLGPFRAVRSAALRALDMHDTAYGWTVEMQIKAIRRGLRVREVPVDALRRRSGRSKVGGTLRGVVGASVGILGTIVRLRLRECRRPAASVLGALLLAAACGAPAPEAIPAWDASDESSAERIDHGAWQDVLDAHVAPDESGVNLVDYEALSADAGAAAGLAAYLDRLQRLDPRRYSRAEQMAYWINLYNALTVKVVLDGYPVDTIRDLHEGVVPYTGPWDDVHARVAGEDLTLNQIEHGILRPFWRDERIHYAVNCAAYGCPHLPDTAFTAENTETLLETGARDYVNHRRGVHVVDEDLIVLSSLYDWYAEDFGGSEESVIAHLVAYADDDLAAFLRGFEGAVEYDYDWSLNRRGRQESAP